MNDFMTTQPSTLVPITLGRETMHLNEKKKKQLKVVPYCIWWSSKIIPQVHITTKGMKIKASITTMV